MYFNLVVASARRKMILPSQSSRQATKISFLNLKVSSFVNRSLLLIVVCTAVITYTLYLKASNHVIIRHQKSVPIETKTFSKDGIWCWFADPRAVYHEGNNMERQIKSSGFQESGFF